MKPVFINFVRWRFAVCDGWGQCFGKFAYSSKEEAEKDHERLFRSIAADNATNPLGVDVATIEIEIKELVFVPSNERRPASVATDRIQETELTHA